MAKIALAVGFAALGVATGGLGWFGVLASSGHALAGLSIGLAVGQTLGNMVFPVKLPNQTGPRLHDLTVSTATNGAPIPVPYNTFRYAANIIWSPGLTEHSKTTRHSSKGSPSYSSTDFSYTASFAAAFGESYGPSASTRSGQVLKVLFDSKVVYDNTVGALGLIFLGDYDPDAAYNVGEIVRYTDGKNYRCKNGVAAGSGLSFGPLHPFGLLKWEYYAGTIDPVAQQKYPAPTLYPGSETQNPDPLIQGTEGVDNTPAFRGLIYAVWEDFPLQDFGNRIPNIQGVVKTGGAVLATPVLATIPTLNLNGGADNNSSYLLRLRGAAFENFAGTNVTVSLSSGASTLHISKAVIKRVVKGGTEVLDTTPITFSGDEFVTISGTLVSDVLPIALHSIYDYYIIIFVSGGDLTLKYAVVGSTATNDLAPSSSSSGDRTGDTTVPFTGPDAWNMDAVTNWRIFSGLSVTFVQEAFGDLTLAEVITDICVRAGMTSADLDVSECEDITVRGYLLTSQTDAKSALMNLLAAFFVDCVESDFVLKFIPRGADVPVMTIPEDDLGIMTDKAKVIEQTAQEQDQPKEVTTIFIDPNIDWQQNKAQQARHSRAVTTKQQATMTLPMVLTPDEGRAIAEKALYLAYLEGKPFNLNLWRASYMQLDPTDVIDFIFQGRTYRIRQTTGGIGADYSSQIAGVSEDSNSYISNPPGGDAVGTLGNPVEALADTLLFLFDIPYLADADAIADRILTGFYVGASSEESSWPGDILYRSSDDANFDSIGASTARMVYGTCSGILADPPTDCWSWDDTSTLTIQMVNGELTGTTDLDVLNGGNALMVGNECIQYVNVLDNGGGSFTISRLLRGRRNTEYASTGHAAAELAIDPFTGLQRMTASLLLIGQLRYYRGVTVGANIADETSTSLTLAANDLKPASPVQITGARDGSNNLTIGWTRRTRYAGDWLNNTGDVPLNEDAEAYEVDIMSGVTVLRTIAWTGAYDGDGNPTEDYSAANQTTDGLTPGNPVSVKIYQISAQVGRGFPGTKTV